MSMTNRVGRPKKFDRNTALNSAVNVFWLKGYDGASMTDLTEAMGINPPSLYAEFGDKLNLYRLAIDRYASNDACSPLVAFEGEPDIEKAVRALLDEVVKYSTKHDSGAKGCFLSSSVATSAGTVEGVQELLKKAIEITDRRLTKRFDAAKADGSLAKNFPSLERARLMFDLRQGLVFRARAGCSVKSMKSDIDKRVQMILVEPDS